MYNVSTNEWHFIGSLNTWRVYGSMVCLSGTLYVLGGTKNNRDRLLSVECYNSTEDKWIEKVSIQVEGCALGSENTFTGCVMKLSKGVLESAPSHFRPLRLQRVTGVCVLNSLPVPVPVFELSDDDDLLS